MPKIRKNAGFTLIELIVVIAIIVILIALIAPNASALIGTSRQTRADANAKTIYTAAQAYLTDVFAKDGQVTITGDKLALSDVRAAGFLTADSAKLTDENVNIGISGFSVTQVTVTDGDAEGVYPKGGAAPVSDRFADALANDDLWATGKLGNYFNQSSVRYIDSTATADTSWSKQVKDFINDADLTSSGSWSLSGKNTPSSRVLLWTEEDISTIGEGTAVSVKKYVWDTDENKFVYSDTVEAKVDPSTDKKYNVLREG